MVSNTEISVLKNLESTFISSLTKTLEDKIYSAKRRHCSFRVFFPAVKCEKGRIPLLRFKPVFYYEMSKAGDEEMELDLIFQDRIYSEHIKGRNTFDVIARNYSRWVFEENEHFYFNMIFVDGVFSRDDYRDSWEDYELYFSIYDLDEEEPERDLRKKLEVGPFYYEDSYESNNNTIRKYGTSTFREEECVICRDAIPNIMFCNCGHIIICEECDKLDFRECLLCKTPCLIKRKL